MKRIIALALIGLVLMCAGCSKAEPSPSAPPTPTLAPGTPGTLTVSFDFERQSGVASNQFAVWIEDMDGQMVKTMVATNYTASGGYAKRKDSIALWVERAKGTVDFDAVAGATPQSGPVAYVWDLTYDNGEAAPAGTYKFLVLGTLRWKNYVLCTGEIAVGGANATAEAPAQFVDETAKECGMIANVRAEYIA